MPFIDDVWMRKAHQALAAVFDVDERTRRDMIQFLFDEGFWDPSKLDWGNAESKWRNNINPTKQEYWKIGEVWALAVRFNRPQLLQAMADSMGYELREVPTEARRISLVNQLQRALDELDTKTDEIRSELSRLNTAPAEQHMPSLPGSRPSFSKAEPTAVERVGSL